MQIFTSKAKADKDWRKRRILISIQAYSELHPMPRKEKRPDLAASNTGFNKIFLRNAEGLLVGIYGEVSEKFWILTVKKILKHSIKVKTNQPRSKARSIKPTK